MIKALALFCLLFVYCYSEICFPWPQDEYVTGTLSNYVAATGGACCGLGDCSTSNRAFYLEALQGPGSSGGSLLGWDPTYSNTFLYDPVQDTFTVTGRVIGTANPASPFPTPATVVFDVQLTFSGVGPCIDSSANGGVGIAGIKQESTCYGDDINGAEITAYCWYCSNTMAGVFTAPPNTDWAGTTFAVSNNMVSEIGFGANGGDTNLGLSAWITIATPTSGPPPGYTVNTGSATNDLDCNLNCNTVCSIDIVFTPKCSTSCKKIVVFIGNDNVKTKKKEHVLCNGECLTLEEPAGTSIWLHERDHRGCAGDCSETEAIFKIDDICTITCLNDPDNELQLIHNSGKHCGLPCPQNFLGPQ